MCVCVCVCMRAYVRTYMHACDGRMSGCGFIPGLGWDMFEPLLVVVGE